jgi:catechol 2,3-dioxygenase-like lactoylglutathione lyase family enzyme
MMEVIALNHVNVTVPRSLEVAAKHFYGSVLGLEEIPKPEGSRGHGGAWYQLGGVQLHLSLEDGVENHVSKRHVCYVVRDLAEAEKSFRDARVEVIPDDSPIPGWPRFYVHDPGGNRIEIAQDSR